MTWNEYYSRLYDWAESTQIRRISDIDDFSNAEGSEVVEAANSFLDDAAATRLVKKALAGGVRFTAEDVVDVLENLKEDCIPTLVFSATTRYTPEQVEYVGDFLSDADYRRLCREDSAPCGKPAAKKRKAQNPGCLAALFIALLRAPKNNPSRKHSGRCEGDCSKCPPHYGYRYGRWYYGHDHSEGCEFGGNR